MPDGRDQRYGATGLSWVAKPGPRMRSDLVGAEGFDPVVCNEAGKSVWWFARSTRLSLNPPTADKRRGRFRCPLTQRTD